MDTTDTKLSELQKTLALQRPIGDPFQGCSDDSCQRWLEENSIVQFSLNKRTAQNAEFIINNNPYHLIWYSQLSEIFFQIENYSLCSGMIIWKDGTRCVTFELGVEQFISTTKGKKFKVVVNPDGPVAKFARNAFDANTTISKAYQIIIDLINKKEWRQAASFLSESKEYTLIEI